MVEGLLAMQVIQAEEERVKKARESSSHTYSMREPDTILAYSNVSTYMADIIRRGTYVPQPKPWYEDLDNVREDIWQRQMRPTLELFRIEVTNGRRGA